MKISSKIRNVTPVELSSNGYPVVFMHTGVGESGDLDQAINEERNKIQRALDLGVDVICDVSMSNKMKYVHEGLMKEFNVPFGTVTVYEAYINSQNNNFKYSEEDFLNLFLEEIKRGFDIITIHATVFKDDRKYIENSNRLISSTSRGGMLMLKLMEENNYENPFYTHFDKILDMCLEYNVCLSLGPMYRPASICDCSVNDFLINLEIERMSELVKKAIDKNVGICIEGIGHAPLNRIPEIIKFQKEKCYNVPYRVMTVATDIALGYDHISSAIASAMAIYSGADSITCVSRSEHIGIPTLEEAIEGVETARIAAYCGYIAKTNDFSRDRKMSIAREKNGCLGHIPSVLFPEKTLEIISKKDSKKEGKSCSMCGSYCPLNKL